MDVRMQKHRVAHWLGSATRAHMDIAWDNQYKTNLMTSAQPVHKSQCSTTTKKGGGMGTDALGKFRRPGGQTAVFMGKAARFIGALLVLFAVTSPVQALDEWVDPLPGLSWLNSLYGGPNVAYPSLDDACKAGSDSMFGGNQSYTYTFAGIIYPMTNYYGTVGAGACVWDYWFAGVYQGTYGHGYVYNAMSCPVPTVNPTLPYQWDWYSTKCFRSVQETNTIKLDLKNATLEPSGTASQNAKITQSFTATVTSNTTQQPKAGAKVTIKAEVEQSSGGHVHTDQLQRPKGYLGQGSSATLCDPNALQPQACITGTTDANGQFTFVFGSPEPSGIHTITATCDVCIGTQDQAQITVKVAGLVSLSGSSTDYVLVGGTTTHSDNHYLTPTAKALAERLAIEYRKKFPRDPRLHFNDASLKEGGVLDICTGIETSAGCASDSYHHYVPMCELQPNGMYSCSWARPHGEHRRGSVIDVRANNIVPGAANYATSIPRRNENDFLRIARNLRINTGSDPHSPNSSNRHWHIKLLGVAE